MDLLNPLGGRTHIQQGYAGAAPPGTASTGGGVGLSPAADPTWRELTDADFGALTGNGDGILTSFEYTSGLWRAVFAGSSVQRDGFLEDYPRFEATLSDVVSSGFDFATDLLNLRIEPVTVNNSASFAGPNVVLQNTSNPASAIGIGYYDHNATNQRVIRTEASSTIVLGTFPNFQQLDTLIGFYGDRAQSIQGYKGGGGNYAFVGSTLGGNVGKDKTDITIMLGVMVASSAAIAGHTQEFRLYKREIARGELA